MPTDEHHILIANDWDCPIVLAGCYRKTMRHTKAEIYTGKTISRCTWDEVNNNSWKLHVIVHGSEDDCPGCTKHLKYGYVRGISAKRLASMVVNSNLPNKLSAKIRLDICYGALGDEHSLASELKKALLGFSPPRKKMQVSGVVGSDALGWGTPFKMKKTRTVISTKNLGSLGSPDDKAGDIWDAAIAANQSNWDAADLLAKTAKDDFTSKKLKDLASKVHPLAKHALIKFRRDLITKDRELKITSAGTNGILLDKKKGTYKKYY